MAERPPDHSRTADSAMKKCVKSPSSPDRSAAISPGGEHGLLTAVRSANHPEPPDPAELALGRASDFGKTAGPRASTGTSARIIHAFTAKASTLFGVGGDEEDDRRSVRARRKEIEASPPPPRS